MKQLTQKIFNIIAKHKMMVLALMLAFIVPSLTQAAQGTQVIMNPKQTYYLDNYKLGRRLTSVIQRDRQGNMYYCLDRGLQGASTTTYTTFSDPILDKLPDLATKVLALGYPNHQISGFTSEADQFYITQIALWAAMTNHNLSMAPSNRFAGLEYARIGSGVDRGKAEQVLAAAKDLLSRAQNLDIASLRPALNLTGSDRVTLQGDNLVAGPFTVDGKNIASVAMQIAVSGVSDARVYNAQSQSITSVGFRQPFYVSFPKAKNSTAGSVKINLTGTKTIYASLWYNPPTNEHQYLARYDKYTQPQNLAISANWDLPKQGRVEISKIDLTSAAPVAGATIEIYNAAGARVYVAKTNSQGKITSPALGVGKYTFKETVAPKGYLLNKSVGQFEIKTDGQIVKAKLTNKRIPDTPVVIIKQDKASGQVLAGAKIEVRDAGNKVIFVGTSNAKGEIKLGALKAGQYSYKELVAPAGYQLNKETYKFTVQAGQAAIKLHLKNDAIPVIPDTPVQILKVDRDTSKPLAGAKIEVYDAKQAKIFSGTTTVDGKVQVGALKAGNYTYKEVAPPKGYRTNNEVYKFTVKPGANKLILTIKNQIVPVGKLQLSKTDLTTSQPLAGATIEIYDAQGQVVYTNTSDDKGLIETELTAGKYTFKETIAPEGYELSTEVGQFEIKQNGEIVKAEMKNKPIPETPVVPSELPKTGPVEAVAALVGIGSITLAIAYWHKSNRALRGMKS